MNFAYSLNDSDHLEIQKKIVGFIYELQTKRSELIEYKTKYNECQLRIQDLEIDLDKERKKFSETKIQLEVAIKASERCETKRVTLREQVAVQAISAEAAYKERNYLKEQNRSLHGEVVDLRRDLDESQSQVRDLLSSVDFFKERMNRNNSALENLQKQVGQLEKDGAKLKKMLDKTTEFCHMALKKVSLQKTSLWETIGERDSLKKELHQLEGILQEERLKQERSKVKERDNEGDNLIKQVESMEESFNIRLKNKVEELKNMDAALRASLESFKSLQAEHMRLKIMFSELEESVKISSDSGKPDTSEVGVGTSEATNETTDLS